jgi:hypothetical protein
MIAKTLAYYAFKFIKTVKIFMVQTPWVCIVKLITAIINSSIVS